MPAATAHLRRLFAINESPARWPVAVKAAVAVFVPLALGTVLGHQSWGLLGTMGSFAVLYGPTTPARFRLRLLTSAAVGFVVCAAIGALTSPWPWLAAVATIAVGVVGAFGCAVLQIGPPGAFFFTLVTGAAGFVVHHGVPTPLLLAWIAFGAATAVVVGMADVPWDRHRSERLVIEQASKASGRLDDVDPADPSPEAAAVRSAAATALHRAWTTWRDAGGDRGSPEATRLADLLRAAQARYGAHHARRSVLLAAQANRARSDARAAADAGRDDADLLAYLRETSLGRPSALALVQAALRGPSPELLVAARTALAGTLAAAVAVLADWGHAYWAIAFAVLMVHQGGTRAAQTIRSAQRCLGTLGGLALFHLLHATHPHGWLLVVMLVALQFVIELLVTRNYAAAVVFITPLALTVATTTSTAALGAIVADRLLDTLLAIAAAMVAIWGLGRGQVPVRLLRAQLARTTEALGAVLTDLAAGDESAEAQGRRRVLHYEIVATRSVLTLTRGDAPTDVAAWARVVDGTGEIGMAALGLCWHRGDVVDPSALERARATIEATVPVLARRDGSDPAPVARELDRAHRLLLTA